MLRHALFATLLAADLLVRSGRWAPFLTAILLVTSGATAPSRAQSDSRPGDVRNAGELQLALKKLRTLGSVLYIAAHPDDENTSLITYLSKGRLLRVGYLSMTRGSGGQNLIASDTGEALGVIRTQELLAARAVDGAEQYFTRAIDFGYSKTADETMEIWGRDKILSDITWVIRNFRPDVIVTRFPTDSRGGHGHHQASAILAKEAFAAAADPKRFPEQLRTVKPWRAKRILWNVFRPDSTRDPKLPPLLTVDLGKYNPLLGRSYTEISAESRSMHKSQGFGAAERRGPVPNYFELLDGQPVSPEGAAIEDLIDGVTTRWSRIPGGERVDAILEEAERTFEPDAPHRILPVLARARAAMRALGPDPWVALKLRELDETIRSCAGLWLEAIAQQPFAFPGGTVPVSASALNRSEASIQLVAIEMPHDAAARSAASGSPAPMRDRPLLLNVPLEMVATVTLPAGADLTHPFWLRGRSSGGAYAIATPGLLLRAENPPALTVGFDVEIERERIRYDVPVLYRWTDRVAGERYRPLEVSPPVLLRFERGVYLFPDDSMREVRVIVESPGGAAKGTVRLDLPRGWRAMPAETTVTLAGPDAPALLRFRVRPGGAGPAPSAPLAMTVSMTTGSSRQTRGRTIIDYPHIPVITLFPEAEAHLVRADVKRVGSRVGYVMGSGDDVPPALEQMGYQVALLSDQDIESAPLTPYDAIVVGIRAYNTRPRLRAMQDRLSDYVSNGGTLVVQYNTAEDALQDRLGPYPFKISRDRVTVEGSPVRFDSPEHRLLRVPNRIGPADFEGWIQERGLYFAKPWSPKFETPISMNDPGEPPTGGSLLVARYGKGTYIYTGISWFRQLPAGVPGAYRLFANLVGAGRG